LLHLPTAIFSYYLENNIIKKSYISATISPFSKKFLNKKLRDKIKIIPCGVDKNFFKIIREPQNFILTVGPTSPTKNQLEIAKCSSNKILIAGEKITPYTTKLSSYNNIKLLGNVSNEVLYDLYSRAKIYVQSGFEGFGISILEAMASGCPVIVKNICGIEGFLKHGHDSLIYNNKKQLKKYITLLWNDFDLYEKISLNGRKTASKFSWKLIGKSWLEMINKYNTLEK